MEGQVVTEVTEVDPQNPTSYILSVGKMWQRGGSLLQGYWWRSGQTYHLTKEDSEHTIRVQEIASNSFGESDPAYSGGNWDGIEVAGTCETQTLRCLLLAVRLSSGSSHRRGGGMGGGLGLNTPISGNFATLTVRKSFSLISHLHYPGYCLRRHHPSKSGR